MSEKARGERLEPKMATSSFVPRCCVDENTNPKASADRLFCCIPFQEWNGDRTALEPTLTYIEIPRQRVAVTSCACFVVQVHRSYFGST